MNATIIDLDTRVKQLRRRPVPALTFQTPVLNMLAVASLAAGAEDGDINKCLRLLSIALQRVESLDMPVSLTAAEAQFLDELVEEYGDSSD